MEVPILLRGFLKPDGYVWKGTFDAELIRSPLCQNIRIRAVGRVPSVSVQTKCHSRWAQQPRLIVGASQNDVRDERNSC